MGNTELSRKVSQGSIEFKQIEKTGLKLRLITMSDEDFVYYESSDEENEEDEEERVTISPKRTAAYGQRVIERQSPRTERLLEQPMDQAILKSVQESCERQELLLNKFLEELVSQRTQMNELVLKVTANQQARKEEATQTTVSTNQLKLDKATAETSAMIKIKESGNRMIKNKNCLLWIRYTLNIKRDGELAHYPILLCLGRCQQISPHSCNYLSLIEHKFNTTETAVVLVLVPSLEIQEKLQKMYQLVLAFPQYHDLAKQELEYGQLIGDKELIYREAYVTLPNN